MAQGVLDLGRIVGESAYEIAVKHGFSGTEADWLLSLVGKMDGTGSAPLTVVVKHGSVTSEEAPVNTLIFHYLTPQDTKQTFTLEGNWLGFRQCNGFTAITPDITNPKFINYKTVTTTTQTGSLSSSTTSSDTILASVIIAVRVN